MQTKQCSHFVEMQDGGYADEVARLDCQRSLQAAVAFVPTRPAGLI